jgi:chemotaxis protein MotB
MADDKPIIIIKKKGGHGGHHGGAWKVAYADFVTAMMAFFMVMWLLSAASSKQRISIASYFRKPGIFTDGSGTPLMMGEAGILSDGYVPPHPETEKQLYSGKSMEELKKKSGTDSSSTGSKRVTYKGTEGQRDSVPDDDIAQRGFQSDKPDTEKLIVNLSKEKSGFGQSPAQGKGDGTSDEEGEGAGLAVAAAAAAVREQIKNIPEIKDLIGAIEIKADTDGLSIEIMDTDKTSMFRGGSAQILPEAEAAFTKVVPVLKKFSEKIEVIGHTDASVFGRRPGGYSNWELSADRANAARRLLEKSGVEASRFSNVIGRADRELKFPNLPEAPGNRRITLKLTFDRKKLPPVPSGDGETAELFKGLERQSLTEPPTDTEQPTAENGIPGGDGTSSAQSESAPPTSAPLQNPGPRPTLAPITAKELLDPIKRMRREKIKLPEGPPPTQNPAPRPGDKIFTDAPVIGPRDPFANLE